MTNTFKTALAQGQQQIGLWLCLAEPYTAEVCATAAIDDAIRTITASGKAAGTLTSDANAARHYLEIGARFVAVGIDVTLLAQATRRLAADFGVAASAPSAPTSGPY